MYPWRYSERCKRISLKLYCNNAATLQPRPLTRLMAYPSRNDEEGDQSDDQFSD